MVYIELPYRQAVIYITVYFRLFSNTGYYDVKLFIFGRKVRDIISLKMQLFSRIIGFYVDGFKNLSALGKRLWLIILVKLFVIFVVLRLLFFPDFLKSRFDSDAQRSRHVMEQLTK